MARACESLAGAAAGLRLKRLTVNCPPASPAVVSSATEISTTRASQTQQVASVLLLIAAALVPISLLWDFSWESTVGIDLFWSWPHVATYLAVAFAGSIALTLVFTATF